jgi:NTP pyrophosphatase (non-canonical NTP hydrolase)
MIDILELHAKMTKHLFAPFTSADERYLALCLCGEAGELANFIKKRWRDGGDFTEEIRDEIADVRVYLELLAACFGISGDKLDVQVQDKLKRVMERQEHKKRMEQWKKTAAAE